MTLRRVRRFWAFVFAAMALLAVGCDDPDPCDEPDGTCAELPACGETGVCDGS
jgi:hypothetical protein